MYFDFIKNKDISDNLIHEISELKIQYWDYPIKEQISWFENNVKSEDIHLILYSEKELIGYMLISDTNVKSEICVENYLTISNVCVSTAYRKKQTGYLLMQLANYYFKTKDRKGILLCNSLVLNFYLKCNWHPFNGKKLINSKEYNHHILTSEKILGETIELEKAF